MKKLINGILDFAPMALMALAIIVLVVDWYTGPLSRFASAETAAIQCETDIECCTLHNDCGVEGLE